MGCELDRHPSVACFSDGLMRSSGEIKVRVWARARFWVDMLGLGQNL